MYDKIFLKKQMQRRHSKLKGTQKQVAYLTDPIV